jgi:hypothetical protein
MKCRWADLNCISSEIPPVSSEYAGLTDIRDSVGGVGWRAPLLPAALLAALIAAVAVSAVAVRADRADEENRRGSLDQGKFVAAEPLRHEPPPCVIAGGTGQRQRSRGRLKPALFGLPVQWVAEHGTLPG